MTFSTHFYESSHLRGLFSVVAVDSMSEIPRERSDYLLFDLDAGQYPRLDPVSAYATFLADCAGEGRWDEIAALNDAISDARRGVANTRPPSDAKACAAMWERAGLKTACAIAGDAKLVIDFLEHTPSPKALADEILRQGAPSQICGGADEETSKACVARLRKAASPREWKSWGEKWKMDPLLAGAKKNSQPWWRVWE
jgi:hypothetical protein